MGYEPDSWTCTVCEVKKGTANHWLIALGVSLPTSGGIAVFEWDNEIARSPQAEPLCGPNCASRYVGRATEHMLSKAKRADGQARE